MIRYDTIELQVRTAAENRPHCQGEVGDASVSSLSLRQGKQRLPMIKFSSSTLILSSYHQPVCCNYEVSKFVD